MKNDLATSNRDGRNGCREFRMAIFLPDTSKFTCRAKKNYLSKERGGVGDTGSAAVADPGRPRRMSNRSNEND